MKAADLAVPWVTTVVCFPDSALPPFNSTLVAHNCDRPLRPFCFLLLKPVRFSQRTSPT